MIRKWRSKTLTSVEVLKSEKAKVAKQNKDRAKVMERRIAKYLKGRRQPGSGSMSPFKGDCIIPFKDGYYLVECKSSAAKEGNRLPYINILLKWFGKLEFERKAMLCAFGILVIHFHGHHNDYVFINENDLQHMRDQGFISAALQSPFMFDITIKKNGVPRVMYNMSKKQLDMSMSTFDNILYTKVHTHDGNYVVMHISDFRDLTT